MTCTMACHKAKTVYDKIQESGLEVLPSPDLNLIGNAWKLLKACISTEKCSNEDKL